jgi:hypothetical protein
MRLEIFDVEHGGCALATTDGSQHVLFDCGHKAESEPNPFYAALAPQPTLRGLISAAYGTNPLTAGLKIPTGWRPSEELRKRGVTTIDRLIVSNYDEDHLSDLPNIVGKIYIADVFTNRTVTTTALRRMKAAAGGIGNGLSKLIHLLENEAHTFKPRPIEGVYIEHFWVIYNPLAPIQDTNNLSLVTFVSCGGLHVIFPGDIESPAWEVLLGNNSFRTHLKQVNVFVASHHGREAGYHPDVFSNGRCSPVIAVISDKSIVHGTQENAASRYGRHVSGMMLNGEPRKVLTTRDDGTIYFDVAPNGSATVNVSK